MADSTHEVDSEHEDHAPFAHPMPVWQLTGIFLALVGLTILTVVVSEFSGLISSYFPGYGRWEIWVSMAIASVKAALVVFFFMHMLFDKPFNQLMFFGSFFFVALFISVLLMDTTQYRPDIDSYSGEIAPAREVNGKILSTDTE